jgi:hypothetical protein
VDVSHPRAFDVVAGDALHARSDFFNHIRSKGKHALAVLKDENRDPLKDARGLWEQAVPVNMDTHLRRPHDARRVPDAQDNPSMADNGQYVVMTTLRLPFEHLCSSGSL